jgi:AcrR family transcriptional regulator
MRDIPAGTTMKTKEAGIEQNTAQRASAAPVGRPRKLSPDAILRAALDIIDARGSAQLSIRALAKQLGVQANAIYTHFDKLESIEEAVVEKLLAQIPMPDASSPVPLREQLLEHFVALRGALLLHPRVTTSKVGSPAWVGNARHLDCALAQLAARGVDMATAQIAYSALSGVTIMSAMQANFYRHEDEADDRRSAITALKSLHADHLQQMMALPVMKLPPEARFRQLIEALIDRLLPSSVGRGTKTRAKK